MHFPVTFLLTGSLLAATGLAQIPTPYGPCDYNGNENCREIMENTACFLNPTSAEQIFQCISGGAEGVSKLQKQRYQTFNNRSGRNITIR